MKLLTIASLMLYATMAQAHGNETLRADSASTMTDSVLHLNEVVVKAARVIHKVDKDIILPTAKIKEASSNGYDLLRKLKLPDIKVNEIQQTVTSYLGNVQIRINDIKSTVQDILSLQPDEVTRIEYIDNPGVRYGDDNLAVVINYIVKRRYAGYVGGATTTQAFWERFNNSNAYFKYNYRKSEFSLSYGLNYRWYDERKNDNHSVYMQPDGLVRNIDYIGMNADMT